MSTGRAVLLIAFASLSFAVLLGWVSRAPADVRQRQPSPGSYEASRGDSFPRADVARHGAYRGPAYLYFALSSVLGLLVLVVLALGPWSGLVGRIENLRGGWVIHVLAAVACMTLITWVASLPLAFVRGFAIEQAWGLSTQDAAGWVSDQLRATGVGIVAGAVAAVVFFGIVRWQPERWWLVGWAAFSVLTIALTVLWPVAIAPLFNTFTPLTDAGLERRALALSEEAGIDIDRVLVADASRRTTTENAYVAGLGATKQLVVYDNLVARGDEDAAAYVIAHELGHRVEKHIGKNIAIGAIGLLAGFALLRVLAAWEPLWARVGSQGVGDLRSLPVLMAFVLVAGLVTLPLTNAVSRRFEREADSVALDLTRDPDTAVRTFRRLAYSNLADLDPHPVVVTVLFTHPSIPERIRAALAGSTKSP